MDAQEERLVGARRRVVIFDDDELMRSLLWRFFDKRNYEIFTFPYPELCPLHAVSECPCPLGTTCADIIIRNVNMLGQNGLDFVEKLLANGCRQGHFALMSGAFSNADIERASHLGCAVFEKPLVMEALTAWVESTEQSIPAGRVLFDWGKVA